MQSLVLVVAAPAHSAVPSRVQVTCPDDVFMDKLRGAVRSPLPTLSVPAVEGEILTFVLTREGRRPPVPCFVTTSAIKRDRTLKVEITSAGRMLYFRTHDGRSHELPFSGNENDFLELLSWCQAGSRYVICSEIGDETATPDSMRYLVNVSWIGKFPRGDRPSNPEIVEARREGDSSAST